MSRINEKLDPLKTKSLEEEIIRYRGVVREAEQVLGLKNHPGWTQILDNIENELKGIDLKLDNFENLSERQLVILLKEKKDFRRITNIVDKITDKLPGLQSELTQLEEEFSKRKEKSGTTNQF